MGWHTGTILTLWHNVNNGTGAMYTWWQVKNEHTAINGQGHQDCTVGMGRHKKDCTVGSHKDSNTSLPPTFPCGCPALAPL